MQFLSDGAACAQRLQFTAAVGEALAREGKSQLARRVPLVQQVGASALLLNNLKELRMHGIQMVNAVGAITQAFAGRREESPRDGKPRVEFLPVHLGFAQRRDARRNLGLLGGCQRHENCPLFFWRAPVRETSNSRLARVNAVIRNRERETQGVNKLCVK